MMERMCKFWTHLLLPRGGGITSLQPVADMTVGLTSLIVDNCRNVQGDVLELPQIHSLARGGIYMSSIKKVILPGGVHLGGINVRG